jgi:hypothetical protein
LGAKGRLVLSGAAWERMAPLIIGRPDQKGPIGRDNRMFVEGVLWIVRSSTRSTLNRSHHILSANGSRSSSEKSIMTFLV